MTNRALVFLLALGPVFSWGCRGGCNGTDGGSQGAGEKIKPGDYEGDDAEECRDGADNDRDGYFDCQDNGCWDSPDCDGSGGDADTDVDADTDADTDADADTDTTVPCAEDICELSSFVLDYTIVATPANAFVGFGGVCPCTMEFAATGTVYDVDPATQRVTFDGTWELVTPLPPIDTGCTGLDFCDCPPVELRCQGWFEGGFWAPWEIGDTTAYHSYRFVNNLAVLDDWVVHDSPTNFAPSNTPISDRQYWITFMGALYDHTQPNPQVNYNTIEHPVDLAMFNTDVEHTLNITFTKTP